MYKLRVKRVTALVAVDITYVLEQLVSTVLTLDPGGEAAVDKFDRQNWKVVIDTDRCPDKLVNVYHVATNRGELFMHHSDVHTRPPCFRCYSSAHAVAACSVAMQAGNRAKHHRSFKLPDPAPL